MPVTMTGGEPQLAEIWARIRGRLKEEVGEVEYRTWLRQMTLIGLEQEAVVILLPTRFLRDWVRSHYGDRVRLLWQGEMPAVRSVEFRISGPAARTEDTAQLSRGAQAAPPPPLAEPLGRAPEPRPAEPPRPAIIPPGPIAPGSLPPPTPLRVEAPATQPTRLAARLPEGGLAAR